MDEPFHSAAVYGHWMMSALARSTGVTVLLDGQGGDEALAGYEYLFYPGFFFSALTRGRVGIAAREAKGREAVQGRTLTQSARELVKVLLPARLRAQKPPTWLREPVALPPLPGRGMRDHHLYGLQVQPLPMYNHQLDRNTMSVALEARNPFLDYRVVECGLALDADEHVHDGYTKWTLREALRDVLPKEVVDRGRKQGFTTDEGQWMREDLGEIMEDAFRSPELAARPYFDAEELLATLERHRAGENRAAELWRAFVVERWLRLFVDPAQIEPVAPSEFSPAFTHAASDSVVRLDGVEVESAA